MTKDGTLRSEKYAAKYDPTVVSARYTSGKDAAIAAAAIHQIAMGNLAAFVRDTLNAAGVAPINSVRFLGYGNKLYSIANKFSGPTAVLEASQASTAWIAKITAVAADKAILVSLWNHFSGKLGTAPTPIFA